jgi:hypothetical protein
MIEKIFGKRKGNESLPVMILGGGGAQRNLRIFPPKSPDFFVKTSKKIM